MAVLVDEALGGWPEAMAAFLEAWEFRPHRVEPLYHLASRLRELGANQAAYLFARQGHRIDKPHDELFVLKWMYDYGIDFEYAILSEEIGDYPSAIAVS